MDLLVETSPFRRYEERLPFPLLQLYSNGAKAKAGASEAQMEASKSYSCAEDPKAEATRY